MEPFKTTTNSSLKRKNELNSAASADSTNTFQSSFNLPANNNIHDFNNTNQHSNKKLKSNLPVLNIPCPLVHLDLNKPALVLNQRPIELCEVSNSVKKALVAVTEQLEASTNQLIHLSNDQLLLVGCLVHESEKSLQELVPYVHSKLLPQTKLEAHVQLHKAFDPLPLATLEAAIQLAAQRINYAPTHSDIPWLPPSLPKGFQIWRWEAQDRSAVVPPELHQVYQKRFDERQLIKPQACALLAALDSADREALLKKLTPAKRKSKATGPASSASNPIPAPSASQDLHPSSQPSPCANSKPKKTRTISEQTVDGHSLAAAPTEKDLLRIQKEQRRREKEEAKQAELSQKKKMGSLLSGWIQKAGPTGPAKPRATITVAPLAEVDGLELTGSAQNGVLKTVERAEKSEFEKVFKPFNLKANTELAPVNRFSVARTALNAARANDKTCAQEPGGHFTPQQCLDQFLSSVSPNLLPSRGGPASRQMLTVRTIVQEIAESEMGGQIEGTKKWRRALQNRAVVPVKLLRFHEDVRPGYVGTWGKSSRLVSGRKPFGKETCLLDYEYDSEADWVEEDGEGEDLGQSDGVQDEGGSSDAGGESDDDGWLVGDEEEVEVEEDEVGGHEACSQTLEGAESATRAKTKVCGPTRRKVVAPLVPVVKGPLWEESLGEVSLGMLDRFRIEFIKHGCVGLDPFTFASGEAQSTGFPRAVEPGIASELGRMKSEACCSSSCNSVPIVPGFPPELVGRLIEIVDGSRKAKPILIEELRLAFLEGDMREEKKSNCGGFKVSKKLIEKMLGVVSVKVGGIWKVNCGSGNGSGNGLGNEGGNGGGLSALNGSTSGSSSGVNGLDGVNGVNGLNKSDGGEKCMISSQVEEVKKKEFVVNQ